MPERRLGRGLSALIPPMGTAKPAAEPARESRPAAEKPTPAAPVADGVQELPLAAIVPNAFQPRTEFEPGALDDLAASVAVHGVLQPVMVRPAGPNRYELVAGERRFRAAEQAGLTRIPAVVRAMTDEESLTVALIENIQREDLNPVEAARGYRQLLDQFHLTQTELARQLGKAQPTIANALSLLRLPDDILHSIASGQLTAEHGKVLLSVADADRRAAVWRQAVDRQLSVAETRRLAQDSPAASVSRTRSVPDKDVHWQALEDKFRATLGLKVTLRPGRSGRGSLVIDFSSPEEVEAMLERII